MTKEERREQIVQEADQATADLSPALKAQAMIGYLSRWVADLEGKEHD